MFCGRCIESKYAKVIYSYVIGYMILKVVEWTYFDGFNVWLLSNTFFDKIFFIMIALRYFYTTFRDSTEKSLVKTPIFWISTSIMIYNSSTLFVFIFISNYNATQNDENAFNPWIINLIFIILYNILFTIALWMKPPLKASISH